MKLSRMAYPSGTSSSDIARHLGLTAGRISQLRDKGDDHFAVVGLARCVHLVRVVAEFGYIGSRAAALTRRRRPPRYGLNYARSVPPGESAGDGAMGCHA